MQLNLSFSKFYIRPWYFVIFDWATENNVMLNGIINLLYTTLYPDFSKKLNKMLSYRRETALQGAL